MTDSEGVLDLISTLSETDQRRVFKALRHKFQIHEMETKLLAPAETILEAISRSSDLTVRGIEGIIAESSFAMEVLPQLTNLTALEIEGDQAYDFLLEDQVGKIRVQVKMQRRKQRLPLHANEVQKSRNWPADHFVVETQRTRTGTGADGAKTRPYRFESFDILAVSMGASQGRWSAFMYTLERWLLTASDTSCLLTYQPVPPSPNQYWTADFEECVKWLREELVQKIPG